MLSVGQLSVWVFLLENLGVENVNQIHRIRGWNTRRFQLHVVKSFFVFLDRRSGNESIALLS